MNYIILDLEWNSAYSEHEGRFVNEIIEIGAVRLDEQLNETGRYQQLVRSRLNKKLSSRTKNLTHITNEDMRSGIPFEKAIADFTAWAGNDTLTLTWSNTDIYVMRENLKLFLNRSRVDFIGLYADLQKFIQYKLGITGNQISLGAAVETAGLDVAKYEAHRALGDVLACADLFRLMFDEKELLRYIVNTATDEYYARMDFKPYYINDLNSSDIDRAKMQFSCEECGRPMKRKSKWQYRNNAFRADFLCSKCDNMYSGRVGFKKTFDGVIVKRRLVRSENTEVVKSVEQSHEKSTENA